MPPTPSPPPGAGAPRVLLVAVVPPPVHGQALAAQYLLDSPLPQRIALRHLNPRFADRLDELGGSSPRKLLRLLRYLWQLLVVGLRWRPQVAVVNLGLHPGPFVKDSLFVLLARLLGMRVVGWFHMSYLAFAPHDRGWLGRYFWFVLRQCAVCVPVSHEQAALFPPNTGARLAVVYYGIPDAPPLAAAAAARTPGTAGYGRVLYLSNMIRSKGWPVLLQAAERVCDALPGVYFDFAGAAPADAPAEAIQAEFARSRHPDRIRWLGPAYGDAKWAAYAAADIFCFPTTYPVETFGLVRAEAMAAGLPVVTTPNGSAADTVVDGETGTIVPANDAPALADALQRLLQDPALRYNMGHRGRARFEAHFSLETYASAWEALLRQVAAGTAPEQPA